MNKKLFFNGEASCLLCSLHAFESMAEGKEEKERGQANIVISSSFYKTFKLILYPFLNT
jgi:hypothetical protein